MATPIKLKRSAVEGKRPGLSDLQLGELALNTNDGNIFVERDTGGVGIATTIANVTPWTENYGGESIYYNDKVGIGTTNPQGDLQIGTGVTVYGNSGIVSATKFYGDGSTLSNLGGTLGIIGDYGAGAGVALATQNLTLVGTTNEIETNADDQQVTIGLPNNVIISNDLIVGSGVSISGITTVGFLTATNDISVSGVITATKFVKSGGTSSQFLKANGDIDDSTYLTEPSTLDDVLGRGNVSGIGISVGISTLGKVSDGFVELYHDSNLVFQTVGTGVSISSGTGNTATIYGPEEIHIDPSPIGVGTTSGIVRIKGDLYVDGTEFIVNSETITLGDFVVGIASTATTDALTDGAGIGIGSIGHEKTFKYEYNSGTNPSLKSSENLNVASSKVYQIAQTEVLSATTLGSGVTESSLTSVGILTTLDVNGHTELATVNVSGASTFLSNVKLGDAVELGLGSGSDLRLYHTGSIGGGTTSYIDNYQGPLYIRNNVDNDDGSNIIIEAKSGKASAVFQDDEGVRLYFDNVEKFATTNDGINVTGILTATIFSGSGSSLTSIPNTALDNKSVSYGGVEVNLGSSDDTPAFNLSDATGYAYTSLTGIVTHIVGDTTPQLGGDLDGNSKSIDSIKNLKVTGITTVGFATATDVWVSGAVTATTFDGSLATSNLSGTISNSQLAGSIPNNKLENDSVSYGGVSVDLGSTDATPAFNLTNATNYPYTSLTGIVTHIVGDTTPQLGGNLDGNSKDIYGVGILTATTFSGSGASLTSIPNAALDNKSVSYGGVSVDLGSTDATPAFNLTNATNYPYTSLTGIVTHIIGDTTPQLGGDLDGNSKNISGINSVTATNFYGSLATTNLTGTITNAQLAGSIEITKLANYSVSYGGVGLNLGQANNTPAFNLTNATNYPYTSLTGIVTHIVGDTTPQLGGDLDGNSKDIYGVGILTVTQIADSNGSVGSASSVLSSTGSGLSWVEQSSGGGDAGVVIKHDDSTIGTAGTINFSTNLDVTALSAGIVTVTASGGAAGLWQQTDVGINTSSKVGIGTTNPDQELHIQAATPSILVEGTNTSSGGIVAGVDVRSQYYRKAGYSISASHDDGEDIFIGRPYASGSGAEPLVFDFQGTERFRITSDGDVGIGTNNPTGTAALTNNEAVLAVGVVTANTSYTDTLKVGTGITATAGIITADIIHLTGGTYDTGINTESDTAIVVGENFHIYNLETAGGYLRTLIEKTNGVISIGHKDTTTVSKVSLYPGKDGSVELWGGDPAGGYSSGLRLNTTTTGVVVSGILTSTSFVKSGGTSSQFLKANGTVDDSTYLTAETDTLDDVLGRGNSSTKGMNVGISTLGNVSSGFVKLYNNSNLVFQTVGTGVSVSNAGLNTATIFGPPEIIIDPHPVGVATTSGIVRIKGDLYVDGKNFIIDSETITLGDFVVGIASTATTDTLADGAGLLIGPNNTFKYEYNSGTNPSLKSSENLNVASDKVYQIAETEVLSSDTLSVGTGATVHSPSSNVITLGTNDVERLRINSSGNLLLGTTTETNNIRLGNKFGIVGTAAYTGMSISQYAGTTAGEKPMIDFNRSRGSSDGTMTSVANDDGLGEIIFRGSDGTNFEDGAAIRAFVDGTPAGDATDMPGRLTFNTSADGDTSLHERLRITSGGNTQFWGTRAGALQPEDDDNLQIYTKSADNSINRGSGITFYNHDNSGYEMGGTIQVAKENGTADNEAAYMRFSTRPAGAAALERLRIKSDGNVLIGGHTQGASDSSKLSVYDSGSNIGIIQVHCGTEDDGDLTGITFGQGGSSTTARPKTAIAAVSTLSYGRGDLCFYVDGTADNNPVSTADEKLRITSAGDVGIGTDAPMGGDELTNNEATLAVGIVTTNDVYSTKYTTLGSASKNKYLVWSSSSYAIGMDNGMSFGGLNDYAMTFKMNSDADRGWWWGDSSHTDAQGAMTLNTIGELVVAKSIRAGGGESDTSAPRKPLDIIGDGIISGDVGIGTINPTGTAALTNNEKVLAVGVVTATSVYGKLNNLTYPTTNGTDGQVLTSDGAGVVQWEDATGGGGGGGSSLWESNATGINTSTNVGIGTTTASDATLTVDVGTASTAVVVQGSEGQLFSVTNSLSSGSIFSVNDISGIPSIDVDADGTIQLAPYSTTEYIGLGITNPSSKLHVVGGTKITGVLTTGQIADDSGSVGTAASVLSSTGSGLSWVAQSGGTPTDITVANEATDTACFPLFATAATGDLGPKSNAALTFDSSNGTLGATDFNSTSDIRLKTNIKPIDDPLAKVIQIEGVSFNWKQDNRPALGVIADQVEKILPQLVHGDDPKTVNYNGLIGLLIEAVKEQQTQIDNLNERLSKLE